MNETDGVHPVLALEQLKYVCRCSTTSLRVRDPNHLLSITLIPQSLGSGVPEYYRLGNATTSPLETDYFHLLPGAQ